MSALPTVTHTLPSGLMATHWLVSELAAASELADPWKRVTNDEASGCGADDEGAPVDVRQPVDLLMLCHDLNSPHVGSRAQNGALDSRVSHAAAKIAVHVRNDLGFGWIGILGEE